MPTMSCGAARTNNTRFGGISVKLSKYSRAIPNRKTDHTPVDNSIHSYTMNIEEMNAKYGAYKAPMKRKFER